MASLWKHNTDSQAKSYSASRVRTLVYEVPTKNWNIERAQISKSNLKGWCDIHLDCAYTRSSCGYTILEFSTPGYIHFDH